MGINDLPTLYFHATISHHRESLLKKIDINKGRTKTDFWKGFYVTSHPDQAFEWAKDKADTYNDKKRKEYRLNKTPFDLARPLVLAYTLDINNLSQFAGKIFPWGDTNWGGFVYNNRNGTKESKINSKSGYIIFNDHNIDLQYPFIYGPLADRQLEGHITDLDLGGKIEDFVGKAQTVGTDQLSFHDNQAVKSLKLIREVKNLDDVQHLIRTIST